MNSNMNNLNSFNSSQVSFDLKKEIRAFSKHWMWFVLSTTFCVISVYFYLRYTPSEYGASGKIMLMLNDGSNPADAILGDMGQFSNSASKDVEDEILVLMSRELMRGVVSKLELNKQIFAKGRVIDSEFFPISGAPFKVNFMESDSLIYESNLDFSVQIVSETSFNLICKSGASDEAVSKNVFFGKNATTPIGDIIVTPNTKNISKLVGRVFDIKIRSLEQVARKYREDIFITPLQEGSKIIDIYLEDPSKNKAEAIINTLVDDYNTMAIEAKSTQATNTADFIGERIDIIATDLSSVEDDIEQFKTGNKLTDITSETSLYLNSNAAIEQELVVARTEFNKINFIKNQINDDAFARIPLNLGALDASLGLIANKYNELLDNRDRLLKSSNEKNPIIVNLDEQLNTLRNTLFESLDNSSKTIGFQIRSLENQSTKISSKIYAVPGQVRKSRDIEREQGVKESLYLYLLEKREEATISLMSTPPNVKIIDRAHASSTPVFPNKLVMYFSSLLVGLLIPFIIIYVKNLLDTKIHNREDLEGVLNSIAIIGEVPRLSGKEKILITRNDRSILSESFRIIRTNLEYIRRSSAVKKYNNVVCVTSTINGEGKSFFSLNMALTIANTGKKVLLIGADVRNPQIYSAIKKNKKDKDPSKRGLTDYLSDKSVSVSGTINDYKINDIAIDILLSGKVPPNPAELLMSDRLKDLFDTVSEDYDYVIVDTAPSMLVTDTLLISEYAGYTIYLTRAGHTEKRILNFTQELNAAKKLNNMMLVVNDVKQSNFGYGAKYGYYGAPEKKGFFSRFRTS